MARRGNVAVTEMIVAVAQEPAPCVSVLTGIHESGPEAATIIVALSTHSECSWTAATTSPWARVTPTAGRGAASLRVDVAANTGGVRTAALVLGGERFEIRQAAAAVRSGPSPTPVPSPNPSPTPNPHLTHRRPLRQLRLRHQRPLQRRRRQHLPRLRRQHRRPRPLPRQHPHRPGANANANPTPTPTPSPPPANKPITVSGTVASVSGECPSVTLRVNGVTVVTNSATDFQKGSCDSLKVGREVTVQGTQNAAGP